MVHHNAQAGGIALSRLSKSYGQVRAVRSIGLAIAAGETVALLGPNGAGKTTTIDMMLGLTRPDAGTVSVFGRTPEAAVRAGWVGGMLQTGSLLEHLKVRELVSLMASYYPHPLDVADLLVLDEPTAGIDVAGRHEFWQAMRAVAGRGKTVLFATHYLEEADAYADRIVLIARGRVIADGPATEIKARAGARMIRATLPGGDPAVLGALPGVVSADRHGDAVLLSCSDADTALRALLGSFPAARDIEVRGGSLKEAFLELTADNETASPVTADAATGAIAEGVARWPASPTSGTRSSARSVTASSTR